MSFIISLSIVYRGNIGYSFESPYSDWKGVLLCMLMYIQWLGILYNIKDDNLID